MNPGEQPSPARADSAETDESSADRDEKIPPGETLAIEADEPAGELAAGVVGLRDRAKRRLLEVQTRKAEARYRSIIEHSRGGIFLSDLHGRLLLVNDALVDLLGYESQVASRTRKRTKVNRMGETKDKLKGKAEQVMGKATKDRRMEAEGVALQARGAVRGAAKDAKRALKRGTRGREPR